MGVLKKFKCEKDEDIAAVTNAVKSLITSQKVMLFMKGSPEKPFCGFSRQIVNILISHCIEFGSYDILINEQVRQGLKRYSDWPTYPQLYVNGDLIGGLDIVEDMMNEGDFKEKLGL